MELYAPAFVRGVLREHGLPHGVTDRVLASGIGADLAAEYAVASVVVTSRCRVLALRDRARFLPSDRRFRGAAEVCSPLPEVGGDAFDPGCVERGRYEGQC